ncbi:type II secretion system protein [Frigoribacterium faeni]|uniref:type II secretion system protein n=1 Tax=Frigoribacterium faeni TaxID=145483 RepID=UPI00141AB14E|nr:prepilin-type N-terminal cleavage/methylation domain-containing protein [Frigoribacterium faeni]NIJ05297.1 type II secretory pathway pseudopilin PulG [Frigoribacterium faeni]
MNRLRARLAAQRSDAGVTIAELLVTIMIFGIVLAVSTSTFVSLARATSSARSLDSGTRETSNGMNALAQIVRSAGDVPVAGSSDAPAFREARADRLQLTTFVNFGDTQAKPALVTYSLDASRRLREERTAAQSSGSFWVFPAGASSSSRLLTASLASGGTPVFRYLDSDGDELPLNAGALTEAQRKQVSFVQVTLAVAGTGSSTSSVTLTNTIGTPNLVR